MTCLQIEDIDQELADLLTENGKLKYRLSMLKRSLEEAKIHYDHLNAPAYQLEDDENFQLNLVHCLQNLFGSAVLKAFPFLKEPIVQIKPSNFADYQFNSSMVISKLLKDEYAIKKSPSEVSVKIQENLTDCDLIVKQPVNPKAPPFINIHLNKEFLEKKLIHIVRNGVRIKPIDHHKRIIVDMSSPNVAKEMHVGHLRSTIIGDCLCKIFEFLGYDVLRLNHIGDWGTQFGQLLTNLEDKYPDFQTNPQPIGVLQNLYKEGKNRFDTDEEFKKRAMLTVGKLQSKDEKVYQIWQLVCEISRKEFNLIYERLNVKNLVERGESFYQDFMKELTKELDEQNILVEDEGRKILWVKGADQTKTVPLTLVKSDGAYTYDTSDLASIKHRIEVEKGDRLIYITDDGQKQHFELIFSVAKDLGILDPKKVKAEHITFGVVQGEDKKRLKTRSGETVRLKDLLDEGLERALSKLKEKGRDKEMNAKELEDAQRSVAYGCIKYNDLSKDRNHAYVFSFDRMLDDRGNTAVYLLYSLARIKSIIRKAELGSEIKELARKKDRIELNHQKEIKLAKHILKMPEILHEITTSLLPHQLCTYIYDLSVAFSEFYENCYCIEKGENNETKVNLDRILLCAATAEILELGLTLLGIQPLEKM